MTCWAEKGDLVHDISRTKYGKGFGPHGIIVSIKDDEDEEDPVINVWFYPDDKQGWEGRSEEYQWSQLEAHGRDFDGKTLFTLPNQG